MRLLVSCLGGAGAFPSGLAPIKKRMEVEMLKVIVVVVLVLIGLGVLVGMYAGVAWLLAHPIYYLFGGMTGWDFTQCFWAATLLLVVLSAIGGSKTVLIRHKS